MCSSFFFNATATTEIYTLSLHDALPIYTEFNSFIWMPPNARRAGNILLADSTIFTTLFGGVESLETFRSEEHTSELQSHSDLVCRLLLEKKKKTKQIKT